MLREYSEGRPIGIKIAAGRIEADLEHCVYAEPDFITIDGRGGATGSSPLMLRENTSVPTIYALARARKYLDSIGSDISLVITGGLRVSADFAKALAMGADAVAIASAALIAAACQQYRICGSGNCPVGIATQDPELRSRLKVDAAAQRVANFLAVSKEEIEMFCRTTGRKSIQDLDVSDLITLDEDIAKYTSIPHAGEAFGAPPEDAPAKVGQGAESKAGQDAGDAPTVKKYRCKICKAEFEVAEGEEAVCPLCKATGADLEEI